MLASFLTQYYEDGNLIPRSVLVQALPEDSKEQLELWLRQQKGGAVTLLTPKRGEKHELVRLAGEECRRRPGQTQCPSGYSSGADGGGLCRTGEGFGLSENAPPH